MFVVYAAQDDGTYQQVATAGTELALGSAIRGQLRARQALCFVVEVPAWEQLEARLTAAEVAQVRDLLRRQGPSS